MLYPILLMTGVFVLGFIVLRNLKQQLTKVSLRSLKICIEKRFEGQEIIMKTFEANFLGLKSHGPRQRRGIGALVLTKDRLSFSLMCRRREVVIPVEKICLVTLKNNYMEQDLRFPMLYIEYPIKNFMDHGAWFVDEPEKWMDAINLLIQSDNETIKDT
ncbi:MAG: hypothetical protein K9L30_07660 [Desulfobacterales bacterium]|nr:hypothetical protein [Desulfobacterales bacterium]